MVKLYNYKLILGSFKIALLVKISKTMIMPLARLMKKYLILITYWGFLFLSYIVVITLAGAIIGAIFYPLVGTILGFNHTVLFMIKKGMLDISYLALVWAPGGAIVLCFIKAKNNLIDNE